MRTLTKQEIVTLEQQGCWAQDWNDIRVKPGFTTGNIRRVSFYGHIEMGLMEKDIEVSDGFIKHSGIVNATLRNVSVGDNCLIENIGNFINGYDIGDETLISNVSIIETNDRATFGEGNLVSVLNEVGDGNVRLFDGLNSQLAALMVNTQADHELHERLAELIADEVARTTPRRGTIGSHVRIVNTSEIVNTHINDHCVVRGASRLSNCSIKSVTGAPVAIGSGVICENSIIFDGSSITNSAKIENCFVGEACQITNGFTAESSLFFANSFMANGEACAAFCGPFTASHHKSSLLIGTMLSFYNGGSATNFSNHAYKMGPMHYGQLERGTKTASGAYLLLPATIGAFSVCFGKLMYHPDTRSLPFSYLIAYSDTMYLVPARTITTVGLYRDIRKWPRRDRRAPNARKSIINMDWLSPFTVSEIVKGKRILERLREASGDKVSTYNYHEYVIKASQLRKGIENYDMAMHIFMGASLKRHEHVAPTTTVGEGEWCDLAGLLAPKCEIDRLVDDIKQRRITNINDVLARFVDIDSHYREYRWAWAYRLILDYYQADTLDKSLAERVRWDYITARRQWIAEIRQDAEKEFHLGDVEPAVFDDFIFQLDKEIEYEDTDLRDQ